jgi:hypothetical protein
MMPHVCLSSGGPWVAPRHPLAGLRCCLAGAGWSLAGGSLNDGFVMRDYRFRLMEQILIIWRMLEFNALAPAPGVTSIPVTAGRPATASSQPQEQRGYQGQQSEAFVADQLSFSVVRLSRHPTPVGEIRRGLRALTLSLAGERPTG